MLCARVSRLTAHRRGSFARVPSSTSSSASGALAEQGDDGLAPLFEPREPRERRVVSGVRRVGALAGRVRRDLGHRDVLEHWPEVDHARPALHEAVEQELLLRLRLELERVPVDVEHGRRGVAAKLDGDGGAGRELREHALRQLDGRDVPPVAGVIYGEPRHRRRSSEMMKTRRPRGRMTGRSEPSAQVPSPRSDRLESRASLSDDSLCIATRRGEERRVI